MIQRMIFFILILSLLISSATCTISKTNGSYLQGSDLIITSVTCNPEVSPGYPFSIIATIFNNGSYNAGKFTLFFFFSHDSVLSTDDTFVGSSGLPLLYAGVQKDIVITETFPNTISEGIYYLITVLEPDTRMIESNPESIFHILTPPVAVTKKELPDQVWFNNQITDAIFTKTNEERIKSGLLPLTRDDDLEKIAVSYANKMVALKFIGHTDPQGNDQNDRAKAAGYIIYRYHDDGTLWRIGVGENLAKMPTGTVAFKGYIDPVDPEIITNAIMNSWLESSGHRKNMMDSHADRIGIGVAFDGHNYYAVQEFF